MWTFIGPVFRSVSIPPAIDIQYFLQSEASPEYCGTCLLRKEAVRLSIVPPSPPPIHMHAHHVQRRAFAISLFQLLLDLP